MADARFWGPLRSPASIPHRPPCFKQRPIAISAKPRSDPSTTRLGRGGRWRMRDFGTPVIPGVYRISHPVLRNVRSPFRPPALGGDGRWRMRDSGRCNPRRVYRIDRTVLRNGRSPFRPPDKSELPTTRFGRGGRWRMRGFGGPSDHRWVYRIDHPVLRNDRSPFRTPQE